MDEEQSLQNFHRINITIWIAIISFIIILTLVAFLIDSSDTLKPIEGADLINQIIFILAVVLASAILFFKRSLFMPAKILKKIGSKPGSEQKDLCLKRLRINYLIVWAMGEAICVLGFVNYIFTVDRQYFLVFAVVGLYSVLINMPRMSLLENCSDENQTTM